MRAEMAAMRERQIQREAARMEKEAAHEAELAQVKADAEAHRKKLAAHEARIKKQEEANTNSIDAGNGLAYAAASASPLSPTQQRQADALSRSQMQRQIDVLTDLVAQLHRQSEEQRALSRHSEEAKEASVREEKAAEELRRLKEQLLTKKLPAN